MKFLRLVALFGSLVLLVATMASLINKRAELFRERDARVESAASLADVSVRSTVLRARAVAASASAGTDPADLLLSFTGRVDACIDAQGERRCSGADLLTLAPVGQAATRSVGLQGDPVAVVDPQTATVIVVARTDVTVVVQLGLDALIGSVARDEIDRVGAVVVVAAPEGDRARSVEAVDGRRIISAPVVDAFDQGIVTVSASVPNGVGWGADSSGIYGMLLAVGAVLLAAAGWTFLVERRQLERRATTDELTGLVNRREFERESEEAIEMAGRIGAGLCIMLIDLNGFKQINDTLGHQVGDLVLQTCANRLRDAVRDTDLVGRWGGDEFVVLLPGLQDASAVRDSAERIFNSLSAAPVAGEVTITGSIGAALYPRHGEVLGDLMHAADEAMYEAKSSGVVHRLAESIPTGSQPAPPSYLGPERRRAGAADVEQTANR